jgi:dipeptidyl aminopeptidase/acylaminoacyl peptidase
MQVLLLSLTLLQSGPGYGQTPLATRLTIADLMEYQNLTAAVVAPDGNSVMFMIQQADLKEGRMRVNLWIADGAGGVRVLTDGTQIDDNPSWSPDGHWLAFRSDRERKPDTAGRHQVWLVPARGGDAVQVSDDRFDVGSVAWSPDGKRLAVTATRQSAGGVEKDRRDKDGEDVVGAVLQESCIFLISVPDGKEDLVYASERPISGISFSPKGDEIAFSDQPNGRVAEGRYHSAIKVVGLTSRQVRPVSNGEVSSSGPIFSPDGKWIAFRGSPQKDWTANHYLYVVPISGGAVKAISRDFDEDVMEYTWAEDSRSVYFTGAQGMDVQLYRATLDGKIIPIYRTRGITRSVSLAGGKMAFIHESPDKPPNVYLGSNGAPTATPSHATNAAPVTEFRRITDVNPAMGTHALGKVKTIRWKNKYDGVEMEGQLLTPPDYQEGRAYPLLVVAHGGPNGQFYNGFALRNEAYPLQVFASEGYVVLMPNPRGSTGYGLKFREMVLKDWGGADFKDIQSGVDDLIARGMADKDHMGIMGWSYGGYLTAWTITQTNRFRAASEGAGPVDLFTMYGGTDIPEFMESYFGGSPWTATQLYLIHSPMAFVEHARTPTLIQQGAEDRRVPTAIGDELYRALKAQGVECEMIRYPHSGHSLGSPKLVKEALTRNLEWFDHYVRGTSEPSALSR